MGTLILRPNSLMAAGSWRASMNGTITTNGIDYVTATSDDSDTTHIAPDVGGMASVDLAFGTAVLPAFARVTAVEPIVRTRTFKRADGIVYMGHRLTVNSTFHPNVRRIWIYESLADRSLGSEPYRPDGNPWTQADIDGLRLRISRHSSADQDTPEYVALYLHVHYDEAPVVTVTDPVSPVTTTSSPTVAWTFADPEGVNQQQYIVRVFDSAQYSAAGFDPATSESMWSSGPVLNSNKSQVVGVPLRKATYRAYVRASTRTDGLAWSAWAFKEWVQDPAAPPVATMTAVVE